MSSALVKACIGLTLPRLGPRVPWQANKKTPPKDMKLLWLADRFDGVERSQLAFDPNVEVLRGGGGKSCPSGERLSEAETT